MTTTPTRLKPLKGEAARIFKLCQDKDPATGLQGLELAAALGKPLEGLLAEVSVDGEGRLQRGKRFTGHEKAQPALDALLLQQLALAEPGTAEAALRDLVRSIDCTVPVVPHLAPLANLESAHLNLAPSFQLPSLFGLGATPRLVSLKIERQAVSYGEKGASLGSLEGLDAPNLELLSARYLGLRDINALLACKYLRTVQLMANNLLAEIDALEPGAGSLNELDISNCEAITSLRPLRRAFGLKRLDIGGLKLLRSLDDLAGLEALERLDFSGCESLGSLQGLKMKSLSGMYVGTVDRPWKDLTLNDLKALTSLRGLPPLAPHITTLSFNRANALVDLEGLQAGAGSVRELQLDGVAMPDLGALGSLVNLEVLEINRCDHLVDASALGLLQKLTSVRIRRCAKLENLPAAWKAPVRSLVITGCPSLKPLQALPPGIDAKTIEIDNRRLLPRAKPIKALKADVGSVWKLLSSREIPNILMGLELSAVLGDALDSMVEGVKVEEGKLVRGKRFTGTGPAQPYLDIALFGLMSRASPGSTLATLREQITELDLSLCEQAPPLVGLINLTRLKLEVSGALTPDLTPFSPMPRLQMLTIGGLRWNTKGSLLSLAGLQAPALTEADLSNSGLRDISALGHSPSITALNLGGNELLVDLRGLEACAPQLEKLNLSECAQLSSLELLRTAALLKELDLGQCAGITSVQPLAGCKALEVLDLERCKSLVSLEGLQDLPIRPRPHFGGGVSFSLNGCQSLFSLAHLPELGPNLQSLSLDDTPALRNLAGLRVLPTVTHLSVCHSGLSDLQHVGGALPGLKQVVMRQCPNLQDVSPLGALSALQHVHLSESAVSNLPQSWSGPVSNLTLKRCTQMTTLGTLPAALKALVCDGSTQLPGLDGMQGCSQLEVISAEGCTALTSVGTPPASLREIKLRACSSLRSLRGLRACPQLQTVALPICTEDAGDLQGLAGLTVSIDVHELVSSKTKGELPAVPKALIDALNSLQPIHLQVKGPGNSSYAQTMIDLAAFGELRSLASLSFGEFDFHCDFKNLTWLVSIEHLEGVWFAPRGGMSHVLGSGVHDSPRKVKALQALICKEVGMALPVHLA